MRPSKLSLHIEQKCTHARLRGHAGGVHGYFGRADLPCHVRAVENHMLHTVFIANIDIDLVNQARNAVLILRTNAHETHIIADGAVNCTGIDVQIAQFLRAGSGHSAFSGSCRAVDGDGNKFAHVASSGD